MDTGHVVGLRDRAILATLAYTACRAGAVAKLRLQDFQQDGQPIAYALDNNPDTGWGIFPQMGKPHTALFQVKEPQNLPEGTPLVFTLEQDFKAVKAHLDRMEERRRVTAAATMPVVKPEEQLTLFG